MGTEPRIHATTRAKGRTIADLTDALRFLREAAPATAVLSVSPTYGDPPAFDLEASWPLSEETADTLARFRTE